MQNHAQKFRAKEGDSRIFDDARSGFVEHAVGPVLFAPDARGGPSFALYSKFRVYE